MHSITRLVGLLCSLIHTDCLAHLNPSTRNLVKFFNSSLKVSGRGQKHSDISHYFVCLWRLKVSEFCLSCVIRQDIPTLEEYSTILMRIFGTIHAHHPQAHIAVLTPPIIGEQRDAIENLLVDQVCDMVRNTAVTYGRKVQVFDLNTKMKR